MTHYDDDPDYGHDHDPYDDRDGWVGYAAIKYGAIVLIVLAILYFAAHYLLPSF